MAHLIGDWRRAGRGDAWGWRVAAGCAAITIVLAARAWATPASGLILDTLTTAVAANGISEHLQVSKNPNGSVTPWQLQMQAQGQTDYILAHLQIPPGGHSGWHSHPGVLVAAVKSGQIDFYDQSCTATRIAAGGVYTENNSVHAIYNSGNETAELYITFLVKHGAGRRLDEPAPSCASLTPIP
jgi:quercetin dioxygenase-like cupin family protein